MATSTMTSYGIIVPATRRYFIVNAQPGEDPEQKVVLNPSRTQLAMIQQSGDVCSVMSDDGPPYTTRWMEFTMNDHGSVASARFVGGIYSLDGNYNESQVIDDQQPIEIANIIVQLESPHADGGQEGEEEQEEQEDGDDNDYYYDDYDADDDETQEEEVEDEDYESEEEEVEDEDYESEEEEVEVVEEKEGGEGDGEMCVICQEEYKAGELIGGLECGHEYHPKCIKKWLVKNRVCPICRFTITAFSS